MEASEWAEVFKAGRAATLHVQPENQVIYALQGMERKAREIADRGRVKETMFMGKPVSKLNYEEAVRFRAYMLEHEHWVTQETFDTVNEIIAKGPEVCEHPYAGDHPYAVDHLGYELYCIKCGQWIKEEAT